MASEIRVPVKLDVLKESVVDIQSIFEHLKPDSSSFKHIIKYLQQMNDEMTRFQALTNGAFNDQATFNKAGKSIDKMQESLNKAKVVIADLKFSDIKLDATQLKSFQAVEDQIKAIKTEFAGIKEQAKQSLLADDATKDLLGNLNPAILKKDFDTICKTIDSEVAKLETKVINAQNKLNDALNKKQSKADEITRLTTHGISKEGLGEDVFNRFFQQSKKGILSFNSRNFEKGEAKQEFLNYLAKQFTLTKADLDSIQSMVKTGSARSFDELFKNMGKSITGNVFTKRLDANTFGDLNGLRNAVAEAEKAQQELAAVQQKFNDIQGDSGAVGIAAVKYEESLQKLNEELVKLQQGAVGAAQALPQVSKGTTSAATELNQLSSALSQANSKFLQVQRTTQNFNQIKMAIVNFMGFRQTLNLVKNAVSGALNHIKELDSVMNKISIVTDMSTSDLWNQVDAYSKMAQTYGVSIKGAYEVSQIYYQQGLKTNDVLTLTNETLKLAKISGLDYAQTTDYMTTALRGFKLEMEDASMIVDVYSNLAAHTAVSSEELAIAMSKTASSMESVGSTFQETSAMIGTMVAVTRESSTNIGTALKSIASRYGEMKKDMASVIDAEGEEIAYNKVDAALQSIGISMKTADGQFREFTDVIIELGEKWDELDSIQQRYIATQFAGNRQQSRFLALVSNVDLLKQNIAVAEDSEDTGALQALKALDSVESKLEQVKVAYQQFYTTVGGETIWKGALDGLRGFIDYLNGLPKLFGKIPLGAIAVISNALGLIKMLAQQAIGWIADTWMDRINKTGEQSGEEAGEKLSDNLEAQTGRIGQIGANHGKAYAENFLHGITALNDIGAKISNVLSTQSTQNAAAAAEVARKNTSEPVNITDVQKNTKAVDNLNFSSMFQEQVQAQGIDLSQMTADTENAVIQIINTIINSSDAMRQAFQQLGTDAAQGYLLGLLASQGATFAAASSLATQALEGIRTTQKSHSPAEEERIEGNNAGEGYSEGIREKVADAAESGKELAQAALSNITDQDRAIFAKFKKSAIYKTLIGPDAAKDTYGLTHSQMYWDSIGGTGGRQWDFFERDRANASPEVQSYIKDYFLHYFDKTKRAQYDEEVVTEGNQILQHLNKSNINREISTFGPTNVANNTRSLTSALQDQLSLNGQNQIGGLLQQYDFTPEIVAALEAETEGRKQVAVAAEEQAAATKKANIAQQQEVTQVIEQQTEAIKENIAAKEEEASLPASVTDPVLQKFNKDLIALQTEATSHTESISPSGTLISKVLTNNYQRATNIPGIWETSYIGETGRQLITSSNEVGEALNEELIKAIQNSIDSGEINGKQLMTVLNNQLLDEAKNAINLASRAASSGDRYDQRQADRAKTTYFQDSAWINKYAKTLTIPDDTAERHQTYLQNKANIQNNLPHLENTAFNVWNGQEVQTSESIEKILNDLQTLGKITEDDKAKLMELFNTEGKQAEFITQYNKAAGFTTNGSVLPIQGQISTYKAETDKYIQDIQNNPQGNVRIDDATVVHEANAEAIQREVEVTAQLVEEQKEEAATQVTDNTVEIDNQIAKWQQLLQLRQDIDANRKKKGMDSQVEQWRKERDVLTEELGAKGKSTKDIQDIVSGNVPVPVQQISMDKLVDTTAQIEAEAAAHKENVEAIKEETAAKQESVSNDMLPLQVTGEKAQAGPAANAPKIKQEINPPKIDESATIVEAQATGEHIVETVNEVVSSSTVEVPPIDKSPIVDLDSSLNEIFNLATGDVMDRDSIDQLLSSLQEAGTIAESTKEKLLELYDTQPVEKFIEGYNILTGKTELPALTNSKYNVYDKNSGQMMDATSIDVILTKAQELGKILTEDKARMMELYNSSEPDAQQQFMADYRMKVNADSAVNAVHPVENPAIQQALDTHRVIQEQNSRALAEAQVAAEAAKRAAEEATAAHTKLATACSNVVDQLVQMGKMSEIAGTALKAGMNGMTTEQLIELQKQLETQLNNTGNAGEQAGNKIQKGMSKSGSQIWSAAGMAITTLSGTLGGLVGQTTELGGVISSLGTIAGGAARIIGGIMAHSPMGWIMGITTAITGLISLIQNGSIEKRIERAEKKAEELSNKSKEAKANFKTLDSAQEKLDDLEKKRYESAESAEEYQTAVDELAEKFPALVQGFDEAGNAILDTSRIEDTLTQAREESLTAALAAAEGERELAALRNEQAFSQLGGKIRGAKLKEDQIVAGKDIDTGAITYWGGGAGSLMSRAGLRVDSGKVGDWNFTDEEFVSNLFTDIASDNYLARATEDETVNAELAQTFRENDKEAAAFYDKIAALGNSEGEQTDLRAIFEALNEKAIKDKENFDENDALIQEWLRATLNIQTLTDESAQAHFSEGLKQFLATSPELNSDTQVINKLLDELATAADNKDITTANEIYGYINEYVRSLSQYSDLRTYANEQLSGIFSEIAPLLTEANKSSSELEVANKYLVSSGLASRFSSTTSKSSGMMGLVTQYYTNMLDKDNTPEAVLQANEHDIQLLDQFYQELGHKFTEDGENMQTKLDEMLADTSHYSYQDIIDVLGVSADSVIGKVLETVVNQTSTLLDSITNNIDEKLKESNLGDSSALNTLLTNVRRITGTGEGEQGRTLTNIERTYWNIAADRVAQLESNGDAGKAANLAQYVDGLDQALQNLDEATRNVILDSIKENGITTKEAISKIQSKATTAGVKETDTVYTILEDLKETTSANILASMRALTDDLTSNWGDSSKSLKKLTSGIDFTEMQDILSEADTIGLDLKRSDFVSDGDKLVLTAEKASEYWEKFSEYNREQAKTYSDKLDDASSMFAKNDEGKYDFIGDNTELIKQFYSNYQAISDVMGDELTNYLAKDEKGQIKYDALGRTILDLDKMDDLRKRLAEKYGEDLDAVQEYLDYLDFADQQIQKSRDWDDGIYSSLTNVWASWAVQLRELARGERAYTEKELEVPDVKNAVEKIQGAYGNLISDVISKGIDKINLEEYKGLFADDIDEIQEYIDDDDAEGIIRYYASLAGKSLDEIDSLLEQYTQKTTSKYTNIINELITYTGGNLSEVTRDALGLEPYERAIEVNSEQLIQKAKDFLVTLAEQIGQAGYSLSDYNATAKTILEKTLFNKGGNTKTLVDFASGEIGADALESLANDFGIQIDQLVDVATGSILGDMGKYLSYNAASGSYKIQGTFSDFISALEDEFDITIDRTSKQYVDAFKNFNDAQIEESNRVNKAVAEELKAITSAKDGDKINLAQTFTLLQDSLTTFQQNWLKGQLQALGADFTDGILTIKNSANIPQIIQKIVNKVGEAAQLIPEEIAELNDALVEALRTIAGLISNGIKGGLSNVDKLSLESWAKDQGIDQLYFRNTADGYKLVTSSVEELYDALRKTNPEMAKGLLSDIQNEMPQYKDFVSTLQALNRESDVSTTEQNLLSAIDKAKIKGTVATTYSGRPQVPDEAGNIQTYYSVSASNAKGQTVLVTPILPNGKMMTEDWAADYADAFANEEITLETRLVGENGEQLQYTLKDIFMGLYDSEAAAQAAADAYHEYHEAVLTAQKGTDSLTDSVRESSSVMQDLVQNMMTDPNNFKFMDRALPDEVQSVVNSYESASQAMKVLDQAAKDKNIGVQDFYNIVETASSLMLAAGKDFSVNGQTAAQLMQAAGENLVVVDGKLKIDLSSTGMDLVSGIDQMKDNFADGIKSLAQAQINMLDAEIKVLEIFAAMEDIGEVDVDLDGISFEVEDIFDDTTDTGWTKGFDEYLGKLRDLGEKEPEVQAAFDSVKLFGKSVTELLNMTGKQWLELGFTKDQVSQIFQTIYQTDWAAYGEDIQSALADMLSNLGIPIDVDLDHAIYKFGVHGQSIEINWEDEDVKTAVKKYMSDHTEKTEKQAQDAINEEVTNFGQGEGTVDLITTLAVMKKVKLDDSGNPAEIIIGGTTYTSKNFGSNKDAYLTAAAADALGLDIPEDFVTNYTENNGKLITNVKIGREGKEVKVEVAKDGETTYKYNKYESNTLDGLMDTMWEDVYKHDPHYQGQDEDKAKREWQWTEWKIKQPVKTSVTLDNQEVDIINNEEARAAVKSKLENLPDELKLGKDGNLDIPMSNGMHIKLDGDLVVDSGGNVSKEKVIAQLKEMLGIDTALQETITAGVTEAFKALPQALSEIGASSEQISSVATALENVGKAMKTLQENTKVKPEIDENALGEVKNKLDALKAQIKEITDPHYLIDISTSDTINSVIAALTAISSQLTAIAEKSTQNIQVNTTYSTTGAPPKIPLGGQYFTPTVGSQSASGTIGLAKAQGTLMGELGPELVVQKGRYFVAGQNGAEFVDLTPDAIVFNHLQTDQLLKHGVSNERGRAITNERNAVAFAHGNINGGPAMKGASAALAQLKKLRSMWQSLLGASAKDLAGLGGSGGGGGGGDDAAERKAFIKDLEIWYNWLQRIAQLEVEINREEKKRAVYSSSLLRSGEDYAKSNLDSLKLLREQAVVHQALADAQQEYLDKLIKQKNTDNRGYDKLYGFREDGQMYYKDDAFAKFAEMVGRDSKTGAANYTAEEQYNALVSMGLGDQLDYDSSGNKIDKTQDDWYVSAVEAFWDKVDTDQQDIQSLKDSIDEHMDAVLENQEAANEIMQEIEDNQRTVEDQVLQAIVDLRQAEIDELQKERDALETSTNKVIDGLSDQLTKEKDMYSQQESADELLQMRRREAILRSGGGSQAEITSLQKDISDRQRDMYFEAQQRQIDALQEAANNELERLDAQIDLMTETLEFEKENGLLWLEVRDIMDMAPENIAAFIMQNTQEFWGQSPLQNEQQYRDVLYNCDEWAAYKKEFSDGKSLKDVAESFTSYAIKQDAKIEQALADSKTYTDVTFNKLQTEIQSLASSSSSGGGGSNNGGSSSPSGGKTYSVTVNGSKKVFSDKASANSYYAQAFGGYAQTAMSNGASKAQAESYAAQHVSKSGFKEGGIVDFTGLTVVHGSSNKPESVLNAEQTEILRNDILGNSPNSLMNLLLDFKNAYSGISNGTSSITNNSSGITIEQAIVEMRVSKMSNDYDAQRAGEQALEKMVQIARKSQGQNRVGR